MNKQELIKKLKDWQSTAKEDKQGAVYMSMQIAIKLAEQLDEPSREECDYFTAPYNYGESTDIDYNICNICGYHEKCDDKFKSNFDVWNYCPNCGSKIKRRKFMNKTLGERIEKLLKQSKLTQKELAAKIGVTEAAVSRYIKDNRDPKIDVIANMATALHTTTDYLLGREESDCIDTQFGKVRMFVARNASEMTTQQKQELIEALLNGKKGLEFVKNVLLPEEKQKDQRIEELENENEEKEDKILDLKSYNSDLKETISKLSFSAVRCQAINDEVCQYILDNELLKKENAELKQKLEEFQNIDWEAQAKYLSETAIYAELEQENKELKEKIKNIVNEYNALQDILDKYDLGGCSEDIGEKLKSLDNAIVPKFKIGQEVWVNATQMNFKIEPEQQTINGIDYYYKLKTRPYWNALEFELFATEQEARKALEELNNGKT